MNKMFFISLVSIMFFSCNKNVTEMELLEGSWISTEGNINSYWGLSSNVSVEFVVYDVNKETASYYEVLKYRNSIDTIGFEKGTLELQEKGQYINRLIRPTSVYFKQNIQELTDKKLRYTFTIREQHYDFTFEKQ